MKLSHRIHHQRDDEVVPESRLLLQRVRMFMGLKSWADFNRVIDGPRHLTNFYAWVNKNPEKRTTPSPKYLLKILDRTLIAAGEREQSLQGRIAELEIRLNNRTVPCDICPVPPLLLPKQVRIPE